MSVKDSVTVVRPTRIFFGDSQKAAPAVEPMTTALDMGEASREQGFRLNGCR